MITKLSDSTKSDGSSKDPLFLFAKLLVEIDRREHVINIETTDQGKVAENEDGK